MIMRVLCMVLTIAAATLGLTKPGMAACSFFPIFHCWLESKGEGPPQPECQPTLEVNSVEAPGQQWPRWSVYNIQVTSSDIPSAGDVVCPPPKTFTFTASWDRATSRATQGTSQAYCTRNPWTGQGPDGPTACSPKIPSTAQFMTLPQRNNLLFQQEPVQTSCQRTKPLDAFGINAAVGETVKVAFAHHENQKIIWHVKRQDLDQSAPPVEVTIWLLNPTTTYTTMRIAETEATFQLDQPGIWWIMAEAVPTTTWAASSQCDAAVFVVKGAKPPKVKLSPSRLRRVQ